MLKRKFIALNVCIRKEQSQTINSISTLRKKPEREEQMKLRVKWNNKILKIRRILIKYKTKKSPKPQVFHLKDQ